MSSSSNSNNSGAFQLSGGRVVCPAPPSVSSAASPKFRSSRGSSRNAFRKSRGGSGAVGKQGPGGRHLSGSGARFSRSRFNPLGASGSGASASSPFQLSGGKLVKVAASGIGGEGFQQLQQNRASQHSTVNRNMLNSSNMFKNGVRGNVGEPAGTTAAPYTGHIRGAFNTSFASSESKKALARTMRFSFSGSMASSSSASGKQHPKEKKLFNGSLLVEEEDLSDASNNSPKGN